MKDIFNRSIHSADPEVLYLIGASLNVDTHRPLPLSIKGLLKYPENYEFEDSPTVAIETDEDDDDDDAVEVQLADFLADHDYALPAEEEVILDDDEDDAINLQMEEEE